MNFWTRLFNDQDIHPLQLGPDVKFWVSDETRERRQSQVQSVIARMGARWCFAKVLRAEKVGDVFQINETHGRGGWIGAFVMATKIKSWGIQGFVSNIKTHEEQTSAYIRLKWSELDYIGKAKFIHASLKDRHD